MSINNFFSNIKFYDEDNFPYQFSRSGDFTLDEANILTHCGYIMQKLEKKEMRPENEEHSHFIGVIEGKNKPLYSYEHVYLKYLRLIDQKKTTISNIKKVSRYTPDASFDGYVY